MLLSDVIMPGMTGPDLGAQIKTERPELKVLHMSGYTGDAVTQPGVFGPEAVLLAKPFSKLALLSQVRAVLESRP